MRDAGGGPSPGRRAPPSVTVPARNFAVPPPARAIGAHHNPRFKDPPPSHASGGLNGHVGDLLVPAPVDPQPSPYATTPMPEDFAAFMGASAPPPGGIAGPSAPPGGPAQEAQLARARAAGRRPPPRAATAEQAAVAAAAAARQRRTESLVPPENAEARNAEERAHEAAMVRGLDSFTERERGLAEFSREIFSGEDDFAPAAAKTAADTRDARRLEPGRPTKDVDDMAGLELEARQRKYLARVSTPVPGTVTVAAGSDQPPPQQADSSIANLSDAYGTWGTIRLNDEERHILLGVLGAAVPIDLTFVSAAQIDALPDGLRAVTRGKLQALRQELLLDRTAGRGEGGEGPTAPPKEGSGRGGGCCGCRLRKSE